MKWVERCCRCEAAVVAGLAVMFIVSLNLLKTHKEGQRRKETYQVRMGGSVELLWDEFLHFGHCPVRSCRFLANRWGCHTRSCHGM